MSAPAARDKVLGAIRASLGVSGTEKVRAAIVRKRLEGHPAGLIPARARKGARERIALFTGMLENQNASVVRIESADALPQTVADYLRAHNLPAALRMGGDALLNGAPWDRTPALEVARGRSRGSDAVTITRASAAAAETGTMFLVSGPDNPTTLNFLPDTHIAVIEAQDILGSYEDAWNRLRGTYGPRNLPRTVNLISGPSRTADIEQTIVMGAHGPRRQLVVIIG